MLVSEFKEKEGDNFPKEFLDLLPEYCSDVSDTQCDSPLEMTVSLTNLRCINPRCPRKISIRINALCKALGIKGIGKEVALKFVEYYGITNPLQIFAWEVSDGGFTPNMSVEASKKLFEAIQSKNTMTLSDYVKAGNLPNIQSSATEIFDGYNTIEEAYEDIEKGGVSFIADKLGIKGDLKLSTDDAIEVHDTVTSKYQIDKNDTTISLRALKIYDSLMEFKNDLIDTQRFVNIITPNSTAGKKLLRLVCSTEVDGFNSKNDFYDYMRERYKDYYVFEFLTSISKKNGVDGLIWSGANEQEYIKEHGYPPRVTNKVKKARDINQQYESLVNNGGAPSFGYIDIMTSKELIDFLDEQVMQQGN